MSFAAFDLSSIVVALVSLVGVLYARGAYKTAEHTNESVNNEPHGKKLIDRVKNLEEWTAHTDMLSRRRHDRLERIMTDHIEVHRKNQARIENMLQHAIAERPKE